MATWLEKLVKILALALDTRIEPERTAAIVIATDLAARHDSTLGRAYLRIERSMPGEYRYLEAKREAAGVARFVGEADREPREEVWDARLDSYPGNRRALEAMLSCTVQPARRRRG